MNDSTIEQSLEARYLWWNNGKYDKIVEKVPPAKADLWYSLGPPVKCRGGLDHIGNVYHLYLLLN